MSLTSNSETTGAMMESCKDVFDFSLRFSRFDLDGIVEELSVTGSELLPSSWSVVASSLELALRSC